MKIIMIRHGMTAGNRQKRYIGRTDEPLCEEGVRQVLALRQLLEKTFTAFTGELPAKVMVAASPMKRSVQSARLLFDHNMGYTGHSGNTGRDESTSGAEHAEELKCLPPYLHLVEDFRECDFGRFENRNFAELSGDPDYQAWIDSGGMRPFPGGEDPMAFRERCCRAFADLLHSIFAQPGADPQVLCIVAHGGTVMSIAERYAVDESGAARGYYDWHIENAQAFVFKVRGSLEDDHFLGRTGRIGL